MLKVISILGCCLFISACIDNSNASQPNDISYSVVSTGLQTGINSQQIHVVKNDVEYSNLISGVQLLGELPNPDFSERMLVGIFTTLNSCYSHSIRSVKDIEGSIVISVNITSENIEACNPVVGNGYIILSTAQSSKQVSVLFKEL